MSRKSAIALAIILVMLVSSFSVLMFNYPINSSNHAVSPDALKGAQGYIVILPDGNVAGTAANAVSHTAGSNVYDLINNVFGNITIERSGAIFNGAGFPITSSSLSPAQTLANISNANDVSFTNTTLISADNIASVALSFYNTSNDKANNLNINTTLSGIVVGGKTSFVNVSNSVVVDYLTGSNATIYSGIAPGVLAPLAASNISFYNLSITENLSYAPTGIPPAIAIASPYTTLEASSITVMGQTAVGVGDLGNNTKVMNNRILLMHNGIGVENGALGSNGPVGPVLLNNTISGNTILLDNTTTYSYFNFNAGIDTNSQGLISNNIINGNFTGAIMGINQYASNSTISHNSVIINSGFGSAAVYIYNSNTSILNNVATTHNGLYAYGVFGQSNSGKNLNNILIENNTLDVNGSVSGGIYLAGFTISNSTVSHNSIVSQGIQDVGALLSGNNTNVIHNSIFARSSSGSGAMADGITYGLNGPNRNVSISSNDIYTSAMNTSNGITAYGTNYSTLSNNHVMLNITQTTLNSNLVLLAAVNHTLISGNTFSSGKNYSTFAVNMDFSQNDTFVNNVFSGSSGLFNFTESGNNLFYHNNFLRYTDYGSSKNSSGNSFNLSYPVGGNYWGPTLTLVDTHSGPKQNLSGSDGIGDTPLTMNIGVDYYPLVYQWNEPTVTFTEKGLPANQKWTLEYNGMKYTSTSQSLTVQIVNGAFQNYSYSAEGTSLYYAQHANGSVAYKGSSVTVNLDYIHYAYLNGSVTPGTFTLYLNGVAVVENSTNFNISIHAGTYELEVVSPSYSPYYENFTVAANQTEQITLNLTKSGNSGLPMQDVYYIGGGVSVVVLGSVVALVFRRRNVGK